MYNNCKIKTQTTFLGGQCNLEKYSVHTKNLILNDKIYVYFRKCFVIIWKK